MFDVIGVGSAVVLQELGSEELLALPFVSNNVHGANRRLRALKRERRRAVAWDVALTKVFMPLAADIIPDPYKESDADERREEHIVHMRRADVELI
jgi:hypothetical protein